MYLFGLMFNTNLTQLREIGNNTTSVILVHKDLDATPSEFMTASYTT